MFNILWVEDESGSVEDVAPAVVAMDTSLSVLLFGDDHGISIPGVQVSVVPGTTSGGKVSMQTAWLRLFEHYQQVKPWLVIMDLQLIGIETDFKLSTSIGELPVAGVVLTQRLFRETDCRNVIWLTRYGPDVVSQTDLFVVDVFNGTEVISFPLTYVLQKDASGDRLKQLVFAIRDGALVRLRETNAICRIDAPRIASLFKLLFRHAGTVKHYFLANGQELKDRVRQLSNFDLLRYNDPPMSFGAWVRAWRSEGQKCLDDVTDENAQEFRPDLVRLLGESLWGMRVQTLPDLVRFALGPETAKSVDLSRIEVLSNSHMEKVIGPVARGLFMLAVQNAVQNALRRCSGRPWVGCFSHDDGIDLLVVNKVRDSDQVRSMFITKAARGELSGVRQIREAIQELNQLHEFQGASKLRFGGWGFSILVDGMPLYHCLPEDLQTESERNWFAAGVSLTSVVELCARRGFDQQNTVAAVFRLPLVTVGDLAERSPKLTAAVVMSAGEQR